MRNEARLGRGRGGRCAGSTSCEAEQHDDRRRPRHRRPSAPAAHPADPLPAPARPAGQRRGRRDPDVAAVRGRARGSGARCIDAQRDRAAALARHRPAARRGPALARARTRSRGGAAPRPRTGLDFRRSAPGGGHRVDDGGVAARGAGRTRPRHQPAAASGIQLGLDPADHQLDPTIALLPGEERGGESSGDQGASLRASCFAVSRRRRPPRAGVVVHAGARGRAPSRSSRWAPPGRARPWTGTSPATVGVGPRTITRASPTGSARQWSLVRARWPSSAPCSPTDGSCRNGRKVACSPSAVAVTRSAAPWLSSRSRTTASSAAKCAGTYTGAPTRSEQLEDGGVGLAAALAHGLQAVADAVVAHVVHAAWSSAGRPEPPSG